MLVKKSVLSPRKVFFHKHLSCTMELQIIKLFRVAHILSYHFKDDLDLGVGGDGKVGEGTFASKEIQKYLI